MDRLIFPELKDHDDRREERIESLLKEPLIQSFLDHNKLKIEDIPRLSLLESYLNSRKKCNGCKGLADCKQDTKGQRLSLSFDGVVYDELEYCGFYHSEKKKDSFLSELWYSDIPERLRYVTLSSLKEEIEKSPLNTKTKLYVLLDKISKGDIKKGLYIYGDLGVGKTFLSIAFINEIAQNGKKGAFVKVNDFINKMRTLLINDRKAYDDILDDIKKVSYLILDDIGTESVSAYSRDDLLFNILDYRMENDLLTIFTSNLPLDDLKRLFTYDKNNNQDTLKARRLIERIRYLAIPFNLDGENMRFKQ